LFLLSPDYSSAFNFPKQGVRARAEKNNKDRSVAQHGSSENFFISAPALHTVCCRQGLPGCLLPEIFHCSRVLAAGLIFCYFFRSRPHALSLL